MKKKKLLYSFILLLVIFVSGCRYVGNQEKSGEELPENVNSTFIFFKEEKANDNQSVGSLYIKKVGGEASLIDNNVLNHAVYDNDTEQVLYRDEDASLFKYKNSEEAPEKIDSGVEYMYFSDTPDKKVIYYTDDNSAYVYGESGSSKIGSYISNIELLDAVVFYNDLDANLYSYNIETNEERRLSSGVSAFQLMNDGQAVAYTDNDGALYYLNLEDDSEMKLASGWVDISKVFEDGDHIYYTEEASEGSYDLYLANIAEKTRSELVTEDVYDFKFQNNNLVYKTSDQGLYLLQEDNVSKRISTDIEDFEVLNNNIYYLDNDGTLFTWNQEAEEEAQIGYDVESYQLFSNGQVFYLSDDGDLFKGDVKLASDVESYRSFYDTLVYAAGDSLYLIKDENTEEEANEEVILTDELEQYSSVYYQNESVYENTLSIADVAGVWEVTQTDDENNKGYYEIKSSGEFTDLLAEESSNLEEIYNGYNKLTFRADSYHFDFIREKDGYKLKIDDEPYQLARSSKEAADEYISQLAEMARAEEKAIQQADDISNAKSTVEDFIYYLPSAVNSGSFSYISEYIDGNSALYTEQFDFVRNLYDTGVMESLEDFQIRDASVNEDGSISITTREIFDIYNMETGKDSRSDYTATYTLVKNGNRYQITNMKVH